MVLKLFGFYESSCTKRVKIILREKAVPYEFVLVDPYKGEHKSPEYLTKQPFGVVPYIDDDGFILYESRAIGRYIAAKYRDQGTPLLPDPEDLKATALFEQAASIELTSCDIYLSAISYEQLAKPLLMSIPPNEETVKTNVDALNGKLKAYDVILSKQRYLAGEEITLADLFHIPACDRLASMEIDVLVSGQYPNVTRWWEDITSRPSWEAVKNEKSG